MRIIRNERHIKTATSIGQYGTLGGLFVLFAGLIISFVKPEWMIVTAGSLGLGYILSMIGGGFADRYLGALAHHDALVGVLKGLDDQYALLQYTLPAHHVLLEPGGCTVFVVKTQGGEVTYQKDGRWKHQQKAKFFRQFAGQEVLGAPDAEGARQVDKLERWLSQHLPAVQVPVRAVIIFANPDVTLNVDGAPVPVFYGKKVKTWLRGPGKLKPLPADVHSQLVGSCGGSAAAA
ncbi:MAG TPA: NERD domain-containing protein [Chloroflexi bacterium]|nr:NERD domain-containing protein [Chloroflexota bacterium]